MIFEKSESVHVLSFGLNLLTVLETVPLYANAQLAGFVHSKCYSVGSVTACVPLVTLI